MNRRSFISLLPKALIGAKLAPMAALAAPEPTYQFGIDHAVIGGDYTSITVLKSRQVGYSVVQLKVIHCEMFCTRSSIGESTRFRI